MDVDKEKWISFLADVVRQDKEFYFPCTYSKISDEDIAKVIKLVNDGETKVFEVNFTEQSIGDKAVKALAELPGVTKLHLHGTRITDTALKTIAKSQNMRKSLTFLDISNTSVVDLSPLLDLPLLTYINATWCKYLDCKILCKYEDKLKGKSIHIMDELELYLANKKENDKTHLTELEERPEPKDHNVDKDDLWI